MSITSANTRDRVHLRIGCVLTLVFAVGVAGANSDQRENVQRALGFDSFGELAESAEGLDWNKESARWLRAVDKVWERNDWNSEAHQYARKMVHDVAVVPPWDIVGRFNVMTECIRERYDLSPDQAARFQSALYRETGGMLMKHGGLIMDQSVEMLRARAAGTPFTPEQVARWTKDGEALTRDSRGSADRIRSEIGPLLRPDQKRVWAQDWAAFEQRWEVVETMRSEWAKGRWDPVQWGLDEDPIQQGLMAGADLRESASELPAEQVRLGHGDARPEKWLAHDPATWIAYVRDMQRRCELSPGQLDAAWSIHAELVERATAYIDTHAVKVNSVLEAQRSTHELYEPVRSVFEELDERLRAMLTDRQRDRLK